MQAAIDSLLSQSLSDLEVIAIDDGSTDGTAAILADIGRRDPRLRILTQVKNVGLVASLNEGIASARGQLIARLDADDVAMPDRLQLQVEVFENDASVALCATGYERVTPLGEVISRPRPPQTHAALAGALLTGNCLCHSSVMFRRQVVLDLGGYRSEWFPVEDYDLWLRLLDVGEYRGVPSIEVRYLVNPDGVSASAQHQAALAEERTSGHLAQLTRRPVATGGFADPRTLQRATLAIAASLRVRGIPTTGLFSSPLGAMLARYATWPRIARHLAIAARAPRLYVGAYRDRSVT